MPEWSYTGMIVFEARI